MFFICKIHKWILTTNDKYLINVWQVHNDFIINSPTNKAFDYSRFHRLGKLQITSFVSTKTPISWSHSSANESPGFSWCPLELSFQVYEFSCDLLFRFRFRYNRLCDAVERFSSTHGILIVSSLLTLSIAMVCLTTSLLTSIVSSPISPYMWLPLTQIAVTLLIFLAAPAYVLEQVVLFQKYLILNSLILEI